MKKKNGDIHFHLNGTIFARIVCCITFCHPKKSKILDSLSVELGFRIPIISGIPNSKSKNFPDS